MRKILLFLTLLFSISFHLRATENYLEEITLLVDGNGELVAPAPESWSTGSLLTMYLDYAHTQKTFNNISLKPGTYTYKVTTRKRNNKQGKVNFSIQAMYKGGSNGPVVSKRYDPGTTNTGQIVLSDYNSKTSGAAGYGKFKVHIGRAGANTNVYYQITLVRKNTSSACTYSSLGSKSGTIVGNTTKKVTFDKKACKSSVTVTVHKKGGRARTTVNIYASSTKNGAGQLKKSYEFPNGNGTSLKNFRINGVKGKFIRIEMRNRSAGNTFQYTTSARQ